MISERIGHWIRGYVLSLGHVLARLGLSANMLTVIGLLLNVGVAVVIAVGQPQWGGVLLLLASAFDMADGAVARATNSISRFGGFLDSTLDRYSEVVVYLGLLVYMLNTGDAELGAILIFIAATGAVLISYARARAESAGYSASVGLVARPERVVLLSICLILGQPLWALWILAVATHVTALTRIIHVWRISTHEPPTAVPTGERQ
ncbi:MAG TPA: CDP-alcohol phosphatidyltransferase family protein [Thermomicrobiales bacterium]|nr:CDP-alcohol phosphatidyltransferase family protein [Thermomicrobiales bacterium]